VHSTCGPGNLPRLEATICTHTVHSNVSPWVPRPQVLVSPVPRSRVLGSPVPGSPGPWVPCLILSANAHGTSMCQCSKYLCQSVVEELCQYWPVHSTNYGRKRKEKGGSEGNGWEGGRGMKDHCNNKTLTSPRKLAMAKWSTPTIFTTLLECNSS